MYHELESMDSSHALQPFPVILVLKKLNDFCNKVQIGCMVEHVPQEKAI